MASTSSSSHLITTSSSQSWKYDAFLSFRGEDTRKTFVAHLYSALVQQGIHTYKDDETLPRGDAIGPSLFKAIRESQIAVIVLSENYADSSWCLDELAYIMECADEIGQIVMPVFYDVDPSDVRKQKGKYGEAFLKFELEKNHKVESWRKALTNVGNLSGWVPKDIANGHEAECIKDIVCTISSRLSPLITNVNKDLIGMEIRLHDLKSKLEIRLGGVRMVGIWGVGGGGKTTLASCVYKEISHQFEGSCFLENVREKSSKHGFEELQNHFLLLVLKIKLPKFGSVEEGKLMIKSRLCRRKVLIVLDDVDDRAQLEALAGSHDWFGEGSRLIITTRDEHLVTCKVDAIYDVSLLSHNEATELFRRHAYREDKPLEGYGTLSQDVISYCDGLPLALKILGSFLYDKDNDEWKSALTKLRDVPNRKIIDKLRISYDGLEAYEKELFLDIACLFSQELVDFAMPILDAFGFHPVIGLKVLAQKSLITISNGRFHMHDLLKEMAHYMVGGEHPKHPEEHTRVWRQEDVVTLCATDTTQENHKIEALVSRYKNFDLSHIAANLKNLRLLWESYSKSLLPKKFQATKLICLVLRRGAQKQLWKGYKHLPNLKIFDLSNSEELLTTPDFEGLPCLERLILKGCKGLKEIHPSIGYHKRLIFLHMKECCRLKRFPPIIQMRKLETLSLSSCHALKKFPEIRMSMDSLIELSLRKTSIEIVPPSVGQYCTNLVSFNLSYCEELKRIEGNFRLLKRLKHLYLEGSKQLEKFAEDFFGVECCIESLDLSSMYHAEDSISFKKPRNWFVKKSFHQDSLSMRVPQFPPLLEFFLGDYKLGDGSVLLNIRELHLCNNRFCRLPSLTRLQSLKLLNLYSCHALVELPNLPSSIAVLDASFCFSLEQVDLSIYKCLWNISFLGCDKLAGWKRVVISLLQETMARNSFMRVSFPKLRNHEDGEGGKYTLQLPEKWYNNFCGFLLFLGGQYYYTCTITSSHEQTRLVDSQRDEWKELEQNLNKEDEYGQVVYVPFASLTHTSWWNTAYTNLSFYSRHYYFYDSGFGNMKVGLVPKSKGELSENRKVATDCSGILENEKPFSILKASKFSIEIEWQPFKVIRLE